MKHIYFSGIGGAGIGPLALIAYQAGFEVTGSDKQNSDYIEYLINKGVSDIHIGQSWEQIEAINQRKPIDWLVYSSAVVKENPESAEIKYATENGIKISKRDEFINEIIHLTNKKMFAVAGTHGKTTTTAMAIWLFKQLNIPASYSVGAKLSFGAMGEFSKESEYFIYEADEYDRNFLNFNPDISVIPGVAYDHPDVYPTKEDYDSAFKQFINQSNKVVLWESDAAKLATTENHYITVLSGNTDLSHLKLFGHVNRQNAHAVIVAAEKLGLCNYKEGVKILNKFPGVSRRFEKITKNIYTDYAHTPEKILGALQLAKEVSGDNVVVVYEGLHNTRQHFIKEELKELFSDIKKLIIVPSYLARENESLEMLTPEKLCLIIQKPLAREAANLDDNLKNLLLEHAHNGDMVICFSAGGGGSLDEWLRREFK